MIILESHKVPKLDQKMRLSDYAAGIFKLIPTRKGMKKAIDKGQVTIDGEPANTGRWIVEGQIIDLLDNSKAAPKFYVMDLEIVYENEYFAIINKPAGISVSGNAFRTIQNAVVGCIGKSTLEDALPWPKPVHRLDNSTSGLLIIAKTYSALVEFGRMFAEKEIQKEYATIVVGKPEVRGVIDSQIDGQEAKTEFEVIKTVPSLRNQTLSLVMVRPKTGRTHQIRIHLSELGFPIFGDKLYGVPGEVYKGKGLFLAAVGLNFKHPKTNENLQVSIGIPPKFSSLLMREERRFTSKVK